jgi:hypothetical protein
VSEIRSFPALEYGLIAPSGARIPLSKEVWEAIEQISIHKRSGSVVIEFRNGGVAGVKSSLVYK